MGGALATPVPPVECALLCPSLPSPKLSSICCVSIESAKSTVSGAPLVVGAFLSEVSAAPLKVWLLLLFPKSGLTSIGVLVPRTFLAKSTLASNASSVTGPSVLSLLGDRCSVAVAVGVAIETDAGVVGVVGVVVDAPTLPERDDDRASSAEGVTFIAGISGRWSFPFDLGMYSLAERPLVIGLIPPLTAVLCPPAEADS